MNRRRVGTAYETRAAEWLSGQGYVILRKNYRCPLGEVDLIARFRETLVFIEVKYRRNAGSGHPAEAVTVSKQRRICRAASWYLAEQGITPDVPCRFDVVALLGDKLQHYQNAFSYLR